MHADITCGERCRGPLRLEIEAARPEAVILDRRCTRASQDREQARIQASDLPDEVRDDDVAAEENVDREDRAPQSNIQPARSLRKNCPHDDHARDEREQLQETGDIEVANE